MKTSLHVFIASVLLCLSIKGASANDVIYTATRGIYFYGNTPINTVFKDFVDEAPFGGGYHNGVTKVKYFIDNIAYFPFPVTTYVNEAINEWRVATPPFVDFTAVSSLPSKGLIFNYGTCTGGSHACFVPKSWAVDGFTSFAYVTKAEINLGGLIGSGLNEQIRRKSITHEIGHAVGLADRYLHDLTPPQCWAGETNSLMSGSQCVTGSDWKPRQLDKDRVLQYFANTLGWMEGIQTWKANGKIYTRWWDWSYFDIMGQYQLQYRANSSSSWSVDSNGYQSFKVGGRRDYGGSFSEIDYGFSMSGKPNGQYRMCARTWHGFYNYAPLASYYTYSNWHCAPEINWP